MVNNIDPLWALTGLIIPLVIHLINPNRGRIVYVGSVKLIRSLITTRTKQLRLTEQMLLTLRLLLLAMVVSALVMSQNTRQTIDQPITLVAADQLPIIANTNVAELSKIIGSDSLIFLQRISENREIAWRKVNSLSQLRQLAEEYDEKTYADISDYSKLWSAIHSLTDNKNVIFPKQSKLLVGANAHWPARLSQFNNLDLINLSEINDSSVEPADSSSRVLRLVDISRERNSRVMVAQRLAKLVAATDYFSQSDLIEPSNDTILDNENVEQHTIILFDTPSALENYLNTISESLSNSRYYWLVSTGEADQTGDRDGYRRLMFSLDNNTRIIPTALSTNLLNRSLVGRDLEKTLDDLFRYIFLQTPQKSLLSSILPLAKATLSNGRRSSTTSHATDKPLTIDTQAVSNWSTFHWYRDFSFLLIILLLITERIFAKRASQ
jgi:hypothetical protein